MKGQLSTLAAILAAIMALGFSPAVLATQCVLSPLSDVVPEATHIFIGTVTEIKYQGDEKTIKDAERSHCGIKMVTLVNKRNFKGGKKGGSTIVYSDDACIGLGVNFELGKDYLVYGMPSDHLYNDTWAEVASLCFRTALLDTPQTVQDVQQLKAMFK